MTHDSALQALRAATHARHARLDRAMPLGLDAIPDLGSAYRLHLRMLLDWMRPMSTWLARQTDLAETGGPDAWVPTVAHRVALLAADLDSPHQPTRRHSGEVECLPALPARASSAFRWGVAYVLEGAQLGAAALHGRLHAALDGQPKQYLEDAAASGRQWRTFTTELQCNVAEPRRFDACCDGGRLAFDRILATAGLSLHGVAG